MTKRRRRDEREPVRIINQEWVENNCTNVTPRDMQMLRLLAKFTLLNSEHLYTLTPGTEEYLPFHTLNQGQKRCNDRIRALYDMHIVNKASPKVPIGEGTSKQYVWLDRAGIKLLGLDRRARSGIPMDYKHTSLVMDVYCSFIRREREGFIELKSCSVESRQEHIPIIPDILAIYKYSKLPKGKALFIEVDRSQKKEADEKRKLEQYRKWQLSESWRMEGWCSKLPKPFFPHVLYLMDENVPRWKVRRTRLEKHARKINLPSTFIGVSQLDDFINKTE